MDVGKGVSDDGKLAGPLALISLAPRMMEVVGATSEANEGVLLLLMAAVVSLRKKPLAGSSKETSRHLPPARKMYVMSFLHICPPQISATTSLRSLAAVSSRRRSKHLHCGGIGSPPRPTTESRLYIQVLAIKVEHTRSQPRRLQPASPQFWPADILYLDSPCTMSIVCTYLLHNVPFCIFKYLCF